MFIIVSQGINSNSKDGRTEVPRANDRAPTTAFIKNYPATIRTRVGPGSTAVVLMTVRRTAPYRCAQARKTRRVTQWTNGNGRRAKGATSPAKSFTTRAPSRSMMSDI